MRNHRLRVGVRLLLSLVCFAFVLSSSLVASQDATTRASEPTAPPHPTLNNSERLPGYGPLDELRWTRGYVRLDSGEKNLHYTLIERPYHTAMDQPLVLWLQGGPGSSSKVALLQEIGPFLTPMRVGPKITLEANLAPWTDIANILFVDGPGAVGYSYCKSPSGCPVYTDETAVEELYAFIAAWSQMHPEPLKNGLIIAGKSYAGVHIPMLAKKIFDSPITGVTVVAISVGNGCGGKDSRGACGVDEAYWVVNALGSRLLMSPMMKAEVMRVCGDGLKDGSYAQDANCARVLLKAREQLGRIYAYNVRLVCSYSPPGSPVAELVYGPCPWDQAMVNYLQTQEVKDFFKAETDFYDRLLSNHTSGSPRAFRYEETVADVGPVIRELVESHRVRVLLSFGSEDLKVPAEGGLTFAHNIGLPMSADTRAWGRDRELTEGLYTVYGEQLRVASISGAGHMAGRDNPDLARLIFTCIVNDVDPPVVDGAYSDD
eukprot:GHVU01229411.1.p1 GENE.GHVU01229411.1~~GHVU01229411.1.p1  ORF type:complete len:488 (-),score=79.01 GHVU01229411.1:219-1682(-)